LNGILLQSIDGKNKKCMSLKRKSSEIEVGASQEVPSEELEAQKRKRLDLYKMALQRGDVETAEHLDRSGLSDEELRQVREEVDKEREEKGLAAIAEKLKSDDFAAVKQLLQSSNVKQADFERLFLDYFSSRPTGQSTKDAYGTMKELLPLSAEFFSTPEFREAFIEKLAGVLQKERVEARKIQEAFKLDKEILLDPRIRQAVKMNIVIMISNAYHPVDFKKFADDYEYPDVFNDSEVRQKAREHVPVLTEKPQEIQEYMAIFDLAESDASAVAQELIKKNARGEEVRLHEYGGGLLSCNKESAKIRAIELILERYHLDQEFLNKELEGFAQKIADKFLSNENLNWDQTSGNYKEFERVINLAPSLKPFFTLPAPQKQIRDFALFNLSKEYKDYEENERRSSGWYRFADKIRDLFDIQKIDLDEIAERLHETREELLDKVKSRTPIRFSGSPEDELFGLFKTTFPSIQFRPEDIHELIVDRFAKDLGSSWEWYEKWVNLTKTPAERIASYIERVKKKLEENAIPMPVEALRQYTDSLIRGIQNEQFSDTEKQEFMDKVRERIGISPEGYRGLGIDRIQKVLDRFLDWDMENSWEEDDIWRSEPWNDEQIREFAQELRDKILALAKEYQIDNFIIVELVEQEYHNILASEKDISVRLAKILLETFDDSFAAEKGFSQQEIVKMRVKRLVEFLKQGNFASAFKLSDELAQGDIARNKEILQAAYEGISKDAQIWFENLDEEKRKEILQSIRKFLPFYIAIDILGMNSAANKNFYKLQSKFPDLVAKYLESPETIIDFFPTLKRGEEVYNVLEAHPFLADALDGNKQYGLKILFQFDKLDKLSRGNIETLYNLKSGVLAEHHGIEEDSPEFRVAMQEKLKDYRRNDEILLSLKKAGIDTEAWLTYDEELRFNLGQETTIPFSEMIVTPIKRIETALNYYDTAVLSALEEFKKELSEKQIPAKDIEAMKKQLADLISQKDDAEQSGNTEKAAGIDIGIKNLESQIAKVKTISVWEKISKGIQSFEVVKNAVFKTYDEIVQLEEELKKVQEGTPVERRKFIASNKAKTEKAKQRLKENMVKLEVRVEDFQKELRPLLTQALTADWADSKVQEIQEQVGENMEHYNSDRTTLANLFAEREGKMGGKPMRIGLWNRNPDQDLYLGNYTDCCIRIDSAHMGAESTIADYMTDLGMQIVAIYDEKKNIPAAVAWCWIGVNNNDRVAFVVDNIEANTTYSAAFKDQLQKQLKGYIEKYAAKIGLPHIVQGQSNNDLTIARMDSAYYKLGGYNRASGYYLEGEGSAHGGEEEEFEEDDVGEGNGDEEEGDGE